MKVGRIWIPGVIVAVSLIVASCSTDSSVIDSSGQVSTANPSVVAVQPDNQGEALLSLFDSAQSSIDIVIYQIGGDDIVDTLMRAMRQRNVSVRIVMDGSTPTQVQRNSVFAERMAREVRQRNIPASLLSMHWASNNFNITHQKSVVIDAVYSPDSGDVSLPETARLLVSTGNFVSTRDRDFYSARDFYVITSDHDEIRQAATVFHSDFTCAGRDATNDLKSSPELIWSNGSTNVYPDQEGLYPPVRQGYFDFAQMTHQSVVQGNSESRTVDVIRQATAGSILRMYAAEVKSSTVIEALTEALKRNVDVRLITTYDLPAGGKENATNIAIRAMLTAPLPDDAPGLTVVFYAPQNVNPNSMFIHAKMVVVHDERGNFVDGVIGSANFTDTSFRTNRELGLTLTADDTIILDRLIETFNRDFTNNATTLRVDRSDPTVPETWPSEPPFIPPSPLATPREQTNNEGDQFSDDDNRQYNPAYQCGPIAVQQN